MNQLLNRFTQLSRAVQLIVVLVGLAVLISAFILLQSPKAIAAFVAGLAVVGLLLIGYEHILARGQGRRLAPLEQAIRGNSAAAFVAISEPARRARLDDLRKNFEAGVQKFRDAGKNLYALPWYMVVGEPGSGKTEAIRHCNVGFPPGLQDQLQGAGGTLNMNWWFTNHAVLLDTAGRLMFEEVEPGATSEWQEFLKLLRRSRPNCPINGMLLVIPSESLVRDSAETIEHKGTKIAQQLDQIQRNLGVRFPVYVVVTKCDLINGFREFFDEIADPQLQHQIVGWSNPAPLDAPFNPEQVDQHLATVRRRLVRRRLGLLLDPVHTEDSKASRTSQVDALYEFPDALMDIAPRLKRYLSMIFVAGEWSSKPLFLRGIYFTSSMREGEALDAKLAEALGVPVESLPEGKAWERDRSFFLRDLFMSKVFREKGLVTTAVSTGKQQAARRGLVYGLAATGLLMLGAFSLLGHRSMNQTMVGPTEFWTSMAAAAAAGTEPADLATGLSARTLPIVAPNSKGSSEFFYRANPDVPDPLLTRLPINEDRKTRARIHLELKERSEQRLPVPWVYSPIAMLGGETDRDIARASREDAARSIFESGVLKTLLDAACVRLKADAAEGKAWTPDSTEAFIQILRAQLLLVQGGSASFPLLDPLLREALRTNDGYSAASGGGAASDVPELQAIARELYKSGESGAVRPTSLAVLAPLDLQSIVSAFTNSLERPPADGGLAGLTRLAEVLSAFDAAERALHSIDVGRSTPDWISDWQQRFALLADSKQKVEADMKWLDNRSLSKAFADELRRYREARGGEIDRLLDELKVLNNSTSAPESSGGASTPRIAAKGGTPEAQTLAALVQARASIAAGRELLSAASKDQTELASSLARLDAAHIVDASRPAFQNRFAIYQRLNDRFAVSAPPTAESDPRSQLASIDSELSTDLRIIDDELRDRLGASREAIEANALVAAARAVARKAANLGADARRTNILRKIGDGLPTTAEAIAESVARLAQESRPAVQANPPMLRVGSELADPGFDPLAASAVLGDVASVRAALKPASPSASNPVPTLSERFRTADLAAAEYTARYLTHWSVRVGGSIKVVAPRSYAELRTELARTGQIASILDPLATIHSRAQEAVDRVSPLIDTANRDLVAKLDAARRSLSKSRSALESPEFRQLCAAVLNRWNALPAQADEARRIIATTASGPAPLEPYYIRAADDDFVRMSWQALTVAWMQSLATDAPPSADRSANNDLRSFDRFPLGRYGAQGRSLSIAEVAAARSALGGLPATTPVTSSVCDRPISDVPAINEAGRRLLGCGSPVAAASADPALAAQMQRWLDVLPADPSRLTCRVSILTDRPPRAGARSVASVANVRMLIVNAPGEPPRGKSVSVRSGDPLGQVTLAAESVLLELLTGPSGDRPVGEPFTMNGPWIPLQLIAQFDGRPSGNDRATWETEVLLTSGKVQYSMWLRLAFDRPLPELPWHR